jgi:predicted ATPase
MLRSIRFERDYRCFREGQTVEFRPGLNLLVGDQGCGKSTIIELVRNRASRHKWLSDPVSAIAAVDADKGTPCAGFDFEKDNYRTRPNFDDNAGLHVAAGQASHGQVTTKVLWGLTRLPSPHLIMLDEPDMALSPRTVMQLAHLLVDLAERGHQVVASCHNPWLIEIAPEVLSLEHGRWMPSGEFLASHSGPVS